jgi:hypothetical protein
MFAKKFYERPLILGIVVAAIIHSIAILIRELSPAPVLSPIIDMIAFNGSWVYLIAITLSLIANGKQVKQFFVCIPERVSSKTIEGQKLVLGYEYLALFVLLFIFPGTTYFYSKVYDYFNIQNPGAHRFIDYMPFADLMNRAMTSFPFFITLFVLVSLLCVIMPHTYLSYKYAKKSVAPLRSAITFSIILSLGISSLIIGLLALSISPWMIIVLFFAGPVIFFSYVSVNIMMLRYHNRFIECD